MIKNQKKNYVSIERKARDNHTVGRLTQLVHTIERINSNTPNDVHESGASFGSAQTNVRRQTRDIEVGENKESDEDATIIEDKELCFKLSQLITELLLMLFAASLLCIAIVVILSRKTPAIMESYEIVPETLFFLCIFVATASFLRWLIEKLKSIFKRKKIKTQKSSSKIQDGLSIRPKEQMAKQFVELKSQDQADRLERDLEETLAIPSAVAVIASAGMATSIVGGRDMIPSTLTRTNNNKNNSCKTNNICKFNNEDVLELADDDSDKRVTIENMYSMSRRGGHEYTTSISSSKIESISSEVATLAPSGRLLRDSKLPVSVGQSPSHQMDFTSTENIIDEETCSINGNYSLLSKT